MADPAENHSDKNNGHWLDRKVIVALTGGIACYKIAYVVSRLSQAGADVRVMMTDAATKFIGEATMQSLSGKTVITSIWQAKDYMEAQHVGHARWCDLMIVAPASANIIAKLSAGICDDIVSLTACALPKQTPVLLAPAMNEQMWENPVTQRNMQTVKDLLSYATVGPETGWQACGTSGTGRMSEPDAIIDAAVKLI